MRSSLYERRTKSLARVLLVLLLFCLPAFATLGEKAASVQADQTRMKGSIRVTQTAAYSVHEIQAEPGVVVREYASPQGTVFAVSWRGPGHPDMHQLLGSYFAQYAQAAQAKKSRRGPLRIQQPGLVVEVSGHARALAGRVYVPQLLPQGVQAEEIK